MILDNANSNYRQYFEKNPVHGFVKVKSGSAPVAKLEAPAIVKRPFKVDIADVISFQREFLGRTIEGHQKECYEEIWGTKGGEWSDKYSEVVLLIGMKGGKNFWAEGDVAYACYFISALKDPHNYFSRITRRPVPYTREKTFDIVNVSSVDEVQARRAFFESVKKILQSTKDPSTGDNWFERYTGLDLREAHGDFTKKEIVFPAPRGTGGIRLLSFNSTSTAPEGVHILRFYADELSRASTKAKHAEATGLLELGLNNTSASFPNRIGKVLSWSYPNDTDFDLTAERYALSQSEPQIFGRKFATWEFNPSVTKEMLADRFRVDLAKAKRVYECEKSTSKDNFFQPYSDKLDEMPSDEVKNKISYAIKTVSKTTNRGNSDFTSIEILNIIGDSKKRCFTCDPSKVRDRFTILGGYPHIIEPFKMELFVGDSFEIINTNVRPVVDIAIVIEPQPSKPIDYIAIGDLFSQLLRAFPNTQSINSDHFQNEKFRQEVISKGVDAATYFFSNQKQMQLYTMLRANVWNNNITILTDHHVLKFANREMNITEAAIWEAKALIREGGKIDHPVWGSKDITDSLAILNFDLMNLEVSGVAEDFDIISDERISVYVERYFNERIKAVASGIPPHREDEINAAVQIALELPKKQFNILLSRIRRE